MSSSLHFKSVEDVDLKGKKVLLRLDINSPIDPKTKRIVNTNRIDKSAPLIKSLVNQGATVGIIAHQGDTLDYQNLISMEEHAELLSDRCGFSVDYIDDVCGLAACERIEKMKTGEVLLLGNLRYLTEEVSTFEEYVKQEPEDMKNVWLVRRLPPLFDFYVNEAFSAAHRNSPSMVGIQQLLPSAAGPLFFKEISVLDRVLNSAKQPLTFLLGGAKISDAFGMMGEVLSKGIADNILVTGVTGLVFLRADGIDLGSTVDDFLKAKNLLVFIKQAGELLEKHRDKIILPLDLASNQDGVRTNCTVDSKMDNFTYGDIGSETIVLFSKIIAESGTIFVNGPAGIYEDPLFAEGTEKLWRAVADSSGYSVIGGGDSVTATAKFNLLDKMSYLCTAGGAMVQYLSGKELPLIKAMNSGASK